MHQNQGITALNLIKKVKRLALKSVLSSKVTDNKIVVLESLTLSEVKTKEMVKVLGNLKTQKALMVLGDNSKNEVLSARNIPGIKTCGVNTINVYDILKYEHLIITKEALSNIEEVYI